LESHDLPFVYPQLLDKPAGLVVKGVCGIFCKACNPARMIGYEHCKGSLRPTCRPDRPGKGHREIFAAVRVTLYLHVGNALERRHGYAFCYYCKRHPDSAVEAAAQVPAAVLPLGNLFCYLERSLFLCCDTE